MNTPLSVIIEKTRLEMRTAVNQVIQKSNLPAYLLEGIILDILADIRSQHISEIVQDCSAVTEKNKEKESVGDNTDGEH